MIILHYPPWTPFSADVYKQNRGSPCLGLTVRGFSDLPWHWHYSSWTSPSSSQGATQPVGIVLPLSSSISDVTQHDTLLTLCVNVGVMGNMTAPKWLPSLRTTRSVTTWLMLLLLCGDIHPNPGPPMNQSIYPCGFCDLQVSCSHRAVCCDKCDIWYHKSCVSILSREYEEIEDVLWNCIKCKLQNVASFTYHSYDVTMHNIFEPLASIPDDDSVFDSPASFHPRGHSSPVNTRQQPVMSSIASSRVTAASTYSDRPLPLEKTNLRVAVVNCQGVCRKKADLENMCEYMDPDVLILTKTKLDPSISPAEFLPAHYKGDIRKDMQKMSSSRRNVPWITPAIRRMTNKKQRLYNRAKRTHKEQHWPQFRAHKNNTTKALRKARWNYINGILQTSLDDGNSKPFWRYIFSQKNDQSGVEALKENGKLHSGGQKKAEILNRQFSSVFTADQAGEQTTLSGPACPPLRQLVVNVKGVEKLLQEINPSKASGPDQVPCRILRELSVELAPVLTAIFMQSLETGMLPSAWRTAYVTPVFKNGSTCQPENYRPVSLTCSPRARSLLFMFLRSKGLNILSYVEFCVDFRTELLKNQLLCIRSEIHVMWTKVRSKMIIQV